MRKLTIVFFLVLFVLSSMLFIGCGGKSQKINGASDEQSEIMDEAMEAEREELPTTYLVESGETLWSIAAKPEIYGNKYQWPLIYDANRDILDDYKNIESGQKLIIPRNVSAIEISSAKERAEELNWPSASSSSGVASSDYMDSSDTELIVASGGVSSSYEEENEDAMEVAGLDDSAAEYEAADSGYSESTDYGSGTGADNFFEEPTPIPEPYKPVKKGGPNFGLIAALLFGVLAVVIFFILKKKKKEEEEEEESSSSDDSSNILG